MIKHIDQQTDLAVGHFRTLISGRLGTGILISPFPIWLDEWQRPENHSNPDLPRKITWDGVQL